MDSAIIEFGNLIDLVRRAKKHPDNCERFPDGDIKTRVFIADSAVERWERIIGELSSLREEREITAEQSSAGGDS